MPDVREVYEMVTKQKTPEPGALERQQKRQVRAARNKRFGAFAVAAAIGVVAIVLILVNRPGEDTTTPAGRPSTVNPTDPSAEEHVKTVDGVPFSFSVPASGWERFGSISINKSETGPQGAEAIIYWSSFPGGDYADPYGNYARPCTRLLSPPVGRSAADLAEAVSTAPGIQPLAGPTNVSVGGYPAKHMMLIVREDVGCDPGFFYSWRDVYGGALWTSTGGHATRDATMRVWIVDVDGARLFIGAATTTEASSDLEREIQEIVGSIRFD